MLREHELCAASASQTPPGSYTHLVFLGMISNGLEMAHEEFKRFIVVSWEIPDLGHRRREKGSGYSDLQSSLYHAPKRFPLPHHRDLESTFQPLSLVQMGKLRLSVEKDLSEVSGGWHQAAPPA